MNKRVKVLMIIILTGIVAAILLISISKKDNLIVPLETNKELAIDESIDDSKTIKDTSKIDVEETKQVKEEIVVIEEVKEKQQIEEGNNSANIKKNQNNNKTETIKEIKPKDENSNKSSSIQNKSEVDIQQNESVEKPKVDEKVEEVPKVTEKVEEKPQTTETATDKVDKDYIYWSSQVDYATYQECFDAGMKEAMKDTVNILGFDCREIYYGGKILGYKLILRYSNPLE